MKLWGNAYHLIVRNRNFEILSWFFFDILTNSYATGLRDATILIFSQDEYTSKFFFFYIIFTHFIFPFNDELWILCFYPTFNLIRSNLLMFFNLIIISIVTTYAGINPLTFKWVFAEQSQEMFFQYIYLYQFIRDHAGLLSIVTES